MILPLAERRPAGAPGGGGMQESGRNVLGEGETGVDNNRTGNTSQWARRVECESGSETYVERLSQDSELSTEWQRACFTRRSCAGISGTARWAQRQPIASDLVG